MKKLTGIIFCAFIITFSNACPICGCGGGNLYMGLLPEFKNQFIGVRYHYAQYHTTLASDPSQFSTNYYNIVELYGGVNIGKRFQLLGFIPYYQNKQVDDDGTTTPHGFGDITVMGQYKVFNKTKLTGSQKVFQQQFWLGAGLKIPTGSFDLDVNDQDLTVADINAQLGTGSTDVLFNALYSARVDNIGISASATYKINSANKENYRYGNKLSGTLIGYYRFSVKKASVSPNAGIGYENVAGNLLHSSKVQYTGSNVTNAIMGVEFNFKKIGFGLNTQLPVSQNFAEGQTQLKLKTMAHVTFAI